MMRPAYRYLRGYSLDPGFSTRLDTAGINEVVYRIPFEDLQPGPIGEYVAVIDFDPASGCWYDPVDLRDEAIASQHGLPPSEGNPQFHQQFVYAVAMKTIRHFERALGRRIIWRPLAPPPPGTDGYVQHLRIHPHALREANAYYDPERRAVLFGYFTAAEQHRGNNYPGGLVFTCLSPDIVAHEMTHAILDAIHPRYIEDTNPDVAAFHEGFADIVALLQRFTFADLVEHQLFLTGGRLDRPSVLGELATQFGEALEGNRGALRSMIGRWRRINGKEVWEPLKPDPADYRENVEPHARGAVLVATIFDAFQRVYAYRTSDLMRIAGEGTGVLKEGSIGRDLVRRLAGEASRIAEHLLHICIRALDYCPPHDIDFGDYLRALITADLDVAPADESGYRLALIEAFRARGIFPDRVSTLSVESLRWSRPAFSDREAGAVSHIVGTIKPQIRELIEAENRHDVYRLSNRAQAILHDQLVGKADRLDEGWEGFLNKLGLTSRPVKDLFGEKAGTSRGKGSRRFRFKGNVDEPPPIEIHTIRPVFRIGREEGRQIEQVLIVVTQSVRAEIGDGEDRRDMVFRGGCSLLLRLGLTNEVEYVVRKSITSRRRFDRQRAYLLGEDGGAPPSASLYADDIRPTELDFNLLHQG